MYADAAYCYRRGVVRSVGLSVTIVSPRKTAEPIEVLFGMWTWVDGWVQGSMYYMGVHIVATWRIRLNRPCAAAMRPLCEVTLTTWYFCCVLCFERSGCI